MNKRLYNAMNWREIEGILYGDLPHPEAVLGIHPHGKRFLVQAYVPGAKQLMLLQGESSFRMEEMDRGFFAAFLDKAKESYRYRITLEDGEELEMPDPYAFPVQLEDAFLESFVHGRCPEAYRSLGAHSHVVETSEGGKISGTLFSVWAPGADAVSLQLDRVSFLMIRHDEYGVFELFLPLSLEGSRYHYRIRKGSAIMDRVDPFGFAQLNGFSRVKSFSPGKKNSFRASRENFRICRLDPARLKDSLKLVKEAAGMGFTHLLIGYSDQGSLFCPDEGKGEITDYVRLAEECHRTGLGLLMDWRIDGFAASRPHFSRFDGTALFEHEDPRKGYRSYDDRFIYQYQSIPVRNYLLSGAMFLMETLGADGIYAPKLGSVLYLDYHKAPGEWVPNFMGENVDRDALSLIRECNQLLLESYPQALRLSDVGAIWKESAGKPEGDCLGFDFTSNEDFARDFPGFINGSDSDRRGNYSGLLSGMHYAFVEPRFLKITDSIKDHYPLAAAFAMLSPGRKLFGPEALKKDKADFLKELFAFYDKEAFLKENDDRPESLEFINHISSNYLTLSFIRKGKRKKELLFVLCNFSDTEKKLNFGVSKSGHYERIYSTSHEERVNHTAIQQSCDDREYCVETFIAPYTLQVLRYKPFTPTEEKRFKRDALEMQKEELVEKLQELKRDRDAFLLEQKRILRIKEEAIEALEQEIAVLDDEENKL